MYLFIEKGIRGGMVNAVKRYAKANNKYMKEYNPNEISKYLMYLDANNLYGWAMIQKLPYDELKFKENFNECVMENNNYYCQNIFLEKKEQSLIDNTCCVLSTQRKGVKEMADDRLIMRPASR
uniref:DNA-directed DNA polymerase n=1 Tax=Acrobeloides nanus TaxID=290746 RepID=A0A914DTK1_9BILA